MSYSFVLMSVRTRLIALALVLVASVVAPSAVQAQTDREYVEVTGRGWGHGRGLGQYGAQGYAQDDGWTSAQILDHFYGGTVAGPASAGPVDPAAVRVEIRSQRGAGMRVNVANGILAIRDLNGVDLALISAGVTVRLSVNGAGVRLETASSCDGPFSEVFGGGPATVDVVALSGGGEDPNNLLRLCHEDGSSTWYDGALRFVNNGGAARTVNVTSIESYLRGVLPAEVPASWRAAALEAQAVAARSYALAGDTRQAPYADTCDTTLCQVYRGRFRQSVASGFVSSTTPSTDQAVAATAGLVRIVSNGGASDGRIARTEFSSSTGGHTAGGAFPAVVDEGDDVVGNPNHRWTTTVDLTSWIAARGLGDLLGIESEGNGLGPDGGRVVRATFVFEEGSLVLTGNEIRQAFGLKSDWFSFGALSFTSASANDAYVVAAYQLFVQREPTIEERVLWIRNLDGGTDRSALTKQLAASDEWAGVMIDELYRTVLGRPSDVAGRSYWLDRMERGLRFESVAAHFYGAPEYFTGAGGTTESFVDALYGDILGRPSDDAGRQFWVQRIEAGTHSRGAVAGGFYASIESRRDRVAGLYQQVLGRGPDQAGLDYWSNRLLSVDDVQLAASLAASLEFYARSQ